MQIHGILSYVFYYFKEKTKHTQNNAKQTQNKKQHKINQKHQRGLEATAWKFL